MYIYFKYIWTLSFSLRLDRLYLYVSRSKSFLNLSSQFFLHLLQTTKTLYPICIIQSVIHKPSLSLSLSLCVSIASLGSFVFQIFVKKRSDDMMCGREKMYVLCDDSGTTLLLPAAAAVVRLVG